MFATLVKSFLKKTITLLLMDLFLQWSLWLHYIACVRLYNLNIFVNCFLQCTFVGSYVWIMYYTFRPMWWNIFIIKLMRSCVECLSFVRCLFFPPRWEVSENLSMTIVTQLSGILTICYYFYAHKTNEVWTFRWLLNGLLIFPFHRDLWGF